VIVSRPRPRAIFFDAVGTLLHPAPPAAEVYASVGRDFGSSLSVDEIGKRFRTSFRRQEEEDALAGHATSEDREVRRWQTIVSEVLDDVSDHEGCFRRLFDHFAKPTSWTLEPDTGPVLATLAGEGYVLGLASNFDRRLHTVRAGFAELAPLRHVVVSSEVGHRKPSRLFFAELVRRTDLPPDEILLIGDDPYNDVAGAEVAGLQALRVDALPGGLGRLPDLLSRSGGV
jgi:putative hydrolase of the HAD superfamily